MPSKLDKTVGCKSLCMCMILEHLHIGTVALIGPCSLTLGWPPCPWTPDWLLELESWPPGLSELLLSVTPADMSPEALNRSLCSILSVK